MLPVAPTLRITSADMTGPDEMTLALLRRGGTDLPSAVHRRRGHGELDQHRTEIDATRDLVAVAVSAPSTEEKRFYRVIVVE